MDGVEGMQMRMTPDRLSQVYVDSGPWLGRYIRECHVLIDAWKEYALALEAKDENRAEDAMEFLRTISEDDDEEAV